MIIPMPIPIFIGNLFKESEKNREIENHLEMINIQASISDKSQKRHDELYSKLSNKQKNKLEKSKLRMFHCGYYDYLDNRSEIMENMLNL